MQVQTGGRLKRIFVLSDATKNYIDDGRIEQTISLLIGVTVYKALAQCWARPACSVL